MAELQEVIIVLGHTLNDEYELSMDSKERMDLAISLYKKKARPLVLSAGDDRWHDNKNVAEKMRSYALSEGIAEGEIFLEPWAKDTVAEYVFLRKLFKKYNDNDLRLTLVTQDWHIKRSKYLLSIIWPGVAINANFEKVDSKKQEITRSVEDDKKSIVAFHETFEGVDFADLNAVIECLFSNHELYVGDKKLKEKVLKSQEYKF